MEGFTRWSNHSKNDMILLVSDGDFSFPNSLARALQNDSYLTATKNRKLVEGFFKQAYDMLSPKGVIEVTHKSIGPFLRWEIVSLAAGHAPAAGPASNSTPPVPPSKFNKAYLLQPSLLQLHSHEPPRTTSIAVFNEPHIKSSMPSPLHPVSACHHLRRGFPAHRISSQPRSPTPKHADLSSSPSTVITTVDAITIASTCGRQAPLVALSPLGRRTLTFTNPDFHRTLTVALSLLGRSWFGDGVAAVGGGGRGAVGGRSYGGRWWS
ncbi:hypothetical protein R6Q59_009029 [Mikania micrantha]